MVDYRPAETCTRSVRAITWRLWLHARVSYCTSVSGCPCHEYLCRNQRDYEGAYRTFHGIVTTPHGYKPGASGVTRPCRPTACCKIFLLALWSLSRMSEHLLHSYTLTDRG